MRKLIIALVAGTLSFPAMAAQSIVLGPPQFSTYENRGQCESALAAERNRQRRNPATRGEGYRDLTGSEFNHASRNTTRCERQNGRWVVVFNSAGF